jgi:hypothetical protein
MRAGDTQQASAKLSHAAHLGVTPAELATEIIEQTGGNIDHVAADPR